MTRSCIQLVILWAAVGSLVAGRAAAFELDGSKWLGAAATFHVDIPGISASQISWNTAFIDAMNEWTEKTVFDFSLVQENVDPCLDNGINSVDFKEDFCGAEFGGNVLAVTVRKFDFSTILGPPYIRESDIVINQAEEFDVFDGFIIRVGSNALDFKRVALHELGHAIGLDHELSAQAIMAPTIGNLFQLQQDDIAGVAALHGGLANCAVGTLPFGAVTGSLSASDCTVRELGSGGNDNSLVDLYRFQLDTPTEVTFSSTSTELDTVLILATDELDYLDVNADANDACDSELSASLEAGAYFLIVNTFNNPVTDNCAGVGDYQLFTQFSGDLQPALGFSTSLEGTINDSGFSGGISADNGASSGNVFSASDSLDINAEITVDPDHQAQPGFIVVAVLINDQILMLNEEGLLVNVTDNPLPPVRFTSKFLQSREEVVIASDLVPAEQGIQELDADIVVGYGLDSNPSDIFFHQLPLNLSIRPDQG